ncbi:MAG: leucyl aminopeptidase family protein [Gammaproteobacteria bacterium]|nr:leucyl aminopeptidase family protein [Gammaproteobacteria bacterium]
MNLLPKSTRLIVREYDSTPTVKQIRGVDHVFLFEPKLKSGRLLPKMPLQKQIDHMQAQAVSKSGVLSHSGDARQPTISYSHYAKGASVFDMLTLARKHYAALKNLNPTRALVLCNDKSEEVRKAFAEAVAAAGHAWICPLTTFKKRRARNRKLRYLDAYKVSDLDIARLKAEADGNNLARVLAALPPNKLTAASYTALCQQLARSNNWECEIFDQSRLQKAGAGAFLAVARGNPHANAAIVRLRHTGQQDRPQLALVGKGVCFDTGGVNLKNAIGMQQMHEDMQGSSVALGTFLTLTALRPDDTLECWLALTENRLDGEAYTPTEIVTAANGTTIEVVHSDAEGRMALADTLHLASLNKPALIIDYATLTGACIYALTTRYSGTFTNRDDLNTALLAAGEDSGERMWPFPVSQDFDDILESDYADIKQCSLDGKGDHIAAARFLSRFVPAKTPWIHVDLSSGHHKGGLAHVSSDVTGVGVRFTCNLVLDKKIGDQLG